MVSGLAVQATCWSPYTSESFSDLGQREPLRIGEPESGRQAYPQNAVLGGQVLILQQQLLVDEARHNDQKAGPMDGCAHTEGSS